MDGKFENLQRQQDEVQSCLIANGLSYEVAVWLADLHVRVRECEIVLLKENLAVNKP